MDDDRSWLLAPLQEAAARGDALTSTGAGEKAGQTRLQLLREGRPLHSPLGLCVSP